MARTIGAEGRGETAAAIALFNLVPIALGIGIPLEVRRLAALGHGASAIRAARMLFLFALPVSAGIGWAFSTTLFGAFEPEAQLTAFAGIAAAPLMMMWTCDSSVLVATGRYRGVMALQLAQPLAYLGLVLAFVAAQALTVATALLSNIAGTLGACITGILLTRISIGGARQPFSSMFRGGIRYAGSSIAEAASSRLDQVIALPLIGSLQAGLYSVAVTVASIPLALGQALGAVFYPLVARSEGNARRELKEEAIRSALAVSVLTAPLLFLGIWVGIPLLFGPQFSGAVVVAWISGIGTCALIVAYVSSLTLGAEGRGYTMTIIQASALGLAIVLLFALAPQFGAVGAAAASSVGYVVLMVALIAATRVRPTHMWPRARDFRDGLLHLFRARK